MPAVFVSIGSNVDRERNIRGAVAALQTRFGELTLSRVYQSEAEGFAGEDFYNLAARFETDQPIERLREQLAQIEAAHGRARSDARFGPRTLDIDILLYGDLIRHDGRIDVPRPEIRRWAFVLGPLAEIAPDARHPETGERFIDLWRAFNGKEILRAVALTIEPHR
jgi:2-amino-4-hydroxy-6-hydroxymethyldihydropteridine diphosphokinase